jgi:hypothetical protein
MWCFAKRAAPRTRMFWWCLETVLPKFQRYLLYPSSTTRRDYFVCGDWHHRRPIAQLRFNDRQLTSDKSRLRTQWKCATARVCICAVRQAHSLKERGFFFVWQCAKVYRLSPKHKHVVYKGSIVMTDVSFWNCSVRKEMTAQQVICCLKARIHHNTSAHTSPTRSVLISRYGFFLLWRSVVCEVR